jgi:hypothetical protein
MSTARRSLAALVVLACITIVTGAAFIAVTYAEWDWLSTLLGSVVILLVILCVRLVLDALENWINRADDDVRRNGEHP